MMHTVVVADDDADLRELVGISVERAGLRLVASVADGRAALEVILALTPDLAILDISMPELTGLEVCREVRREVTQHDVRILLLSASADEASRAAGLESGADHFMIKPFSPRDLVAWLSTGKEAR